MIEMPNQILVVEDDEAMREFMALALEQDGYDVWQACNGLEALQVLQRKKTIGLICLDLRMPVMDGYSFIKEFRRILDHRIPILVITAADDTEQRAFEARPEAWLSKPFDFDEFSQTVARMVLSQNTPTS
jgi:CheY-like chemotaxis protein